MRSWRRGRADARLGEAVEDAYVGLFASLMLGAIAVSVLRGLGELAAGGCGPGCQGARAIAPLAVSLGALGLLVSLARLIGPVVATPAVGSWLLSSPVDRGALLRPRATAGVVVGALLLAAVSAATATLSAWSTTTGAALTVATALLAVVGLGLTVREQAAGATRGSRVVAALPSVVAWALLLAVALGAVRGIDPDGVPGWLAVAVPVVLAPLALVAALVGSRTLGRLPRGRVQRAGGLVPAVSGALATLDLSLAWDVVSDHRWRGRGAVRPRRGRWDGPSALVWADLVRLRRRPWPLLRLALAAVVPLATSASGAGAVNVLVVALVGFLAGLPLLASLRVLERSAGLTRLLPFPVRTARGAAAVVPVLLLATYGVALAPALPPVDGRPLVALAAGIAATAAAVRWMTGRPPDYSKPLVSTPAGGVPTNLYGSALRGFDVLVLTTAPVLLSYSTTGALWSLGLSAVVLAYLLGRD